MRNLESLNGIEVRGGAVSHIVNGFTTFPSLANKYLARCDLIAEMSGGHLVVNKPWVSLPRWLETFQIMLDDLGPSALFQLGLHVVKNPNMFVVGNLRATLERMDIAYHLSHRKGAEVMYDPIKGRMIEGIGHYAVTDGGAPDDGKGGRLILVHSDTPYPCPGEIGMLTGIATCVEPRARVHHENESRCRLKGKDRCTYAVRW